MAMFLSRIFIRRLTITFVLILFLWFIYAFRTLFDVPNKNSDHLVSLENKIVDIESRIDYELFESKNLLENVNEQLKIIKPIVAQNTIKNLDVNPPTLPVLVIACDRITVKRCIDSLIKYRPDTDIFPIIISQDCGHNETYEALKEYTVDPSITIVRQPDLSEIPLMKQMVKFRGYYKIARHFKFALNHVLDTLGHKAVIIVEDDLEIAPDFFEYFLGTYPLMKQDESIWCISAWNDNGKKNLIDRSRPELLHRTDFFPGLGWMLEKETWLRLRENWPPAFFDDWLRVPININGKSCIRPEISRTYSFGKVGVSKGLFFDLHLKYIQLNIDPVDFTKLDLSYLLKGNYDINLKRTIESVRFMSAEEIMSSAMVENPEPVKVYYTNAKTFQRQAKKLGLMDDFRSGIPRTAYRGVVSCFIKGRRVYLVPNYNWSGYDPGWS